MLSEHEVLAWFKKLGGSDRILFCCNLFSCCLPLELRYFVTYLTGTKLAADKANLKFNTTLWTLDDPITRSELVIFLVFLECDNKMSAKVIYEFFLQRCPVDWIEMVSDKTVLSQLELLLTLAANHPAFSFVQKFYFYELLEHLKRAKLEIKDEVCVQSSTHNELSSADLFSSSPAEHTAISLEGTPSVSLLNECRDIPQKDSASQPEDQRESLPEEEPHSSSPSKVHACDSLKNEMCSSDSSEVTSSLLKENVNGVLQVSSTSSQLEDVSAMLVKEQSFDPSANNTSVMLVKEQSYSSQSENSTSVMPVKEQSYSSQSEGGTSVMPVKEKSSGPSEENILSQEKLSSSSLEAKGSVNLEKIVELPAASTAILNRAVARHSGKIRNLELKRQGKKGAYRIEVTWSSGKKTESLKTFKELKEFQQMVTEMASGSSLCKATNKYPSPLPDVFSLASLCEYLVERHDQVAAFLSDFLMLPLSIRDSECAVKFFESSVSQPPRPILVGQGNLNQCSFVEKQNPVPFRHASYRYRNNARHYGFPERQFRNSSSSWNSPSNIHSWNSHRSSYSTNHPKSFRQEKLKFYPPISGFSSSCSSQNSQSGSSQNSRSSSPGGEHGCGRKNSVQNNQSNMKNDQCAFLEPEFPKTKPDNVRNQCSYNKENKWISSGTRIVLCNK